MPQTRNNGGVVPVPSDPYNPPADMATTVDSLDVVRRVPSQTAQNALTDLRVGTMMCRTDLPGQPVFTYDGANWLAVAPELEFNQGGNRGVIKGREILAVTTEFSTGRVVFATPFPNACSSCTLTNSTSAVTFVNFRILNRTASYVEFVAYDANGNGLPSSGIYINYVAVGY